MILLDTYVHTLLLGCGLSRGRSILLLETVPSPAYIGRHLTIRGYGI